MAKKLEQIAQSEGAWVRVSDGSAVNPHPLGKPIVDIRLKWEPVYSIIKRHAKRQKLWDKANAYDATVRDHMYFERTELIGCQLLGGQLYII